MGLDLVELVMETEERFGVHLPDDECAGVRTVADLASLVVSKLAIDSSTCPTSHTFYQVRRAWIETGLPRGGIRPDTRLDHVKPRVRRQLWRKLEGLDGGARVRSQSRRVHTIADLVRLMTPAPMPKDPGERIVTEHMILEEIRQITSEQLGIALERIRPDSEFVKDLGAG